MIDASKYRVSVQKRETEDGLLYEGTVHELPDVLTLGDTYSEAYELAIDAIEGLADLAAEMGHSFPVPSSRETEFSGKFVVRIPVWLHRDLAEEAKEQKASLNSYVQSVLSAHRSRGNTVFQEATEELHAPVSDALTFIAVTSGDVIFKDVDGEQSESSSNNLIGTDFGIQRILGNPDMMHSFWRD